ncbi:hypothetical protein SAY87_011004 [Trapa incisa]|uniref:Uncharacterized protein n=1 Tax=Trapa incisa TaxID=236973 RepID=A0AAN7GRB9_9MYRT|nr:hypothetical protein SAY87_011004 [Trapa incisa]
MLVHNKFISYIDNLKYLILFYSLNNEKLYILWWTFVRTSNSFTQNVTNETIQTQQKYELDLPTMFSVILHFAEEDYLASISNLLCLDAGAVFHVLVDGLVLIRCAYIST